MLELLYSYSNTILQKRKSISHKLNGKNEGKYMSFYSIASSTSIWRGYDYYKNDKVLYCDKITDTEFVGVCEGSNEEKYEIYINTEHPKRSTCTCRMLKGQNDAVSIKLHFSLLHFLMRQKNIIMTLWQIWKSRNNMKKKLK